MTDGERWARDALAELAGARWSPRAVGRFLAASQARANANRRARPDLARQAWTWSLAGAAGQVAWGAPGGLRWWCAVALMLDWHLGMVEGEDGVPRPLGPADACTLARAWLVPVVGERHRPTLVAAGFATDVADGALARATVPTRLGRDLESLVDSAFALAALRASAVPRPVAAAEAVRVAGGVLWSVGGYLRGSPARAPRHRGASLLRAAGLVTRDPRLAGALVGSGTALAVLAQRRG